MDKDTTASELRLAVVLAVVGGVESLTQSVCGRHMQLIVLQMLGGMISYDYQRPAIQRNNSSYPMASLYPMVSRYPCRCAAFVDQVPSVEPLHASIGLIVVFVESSIFHYAHPVLSRPTVPNINVFRLSA